MKISVVTPNYNYAAYIAQTIESIIFQNDPDFEHVIVDDGSTDNSVEVIQAFIDKYPGKIVLIRQENRGQTPAINRGMQAATGDVICWINSDDTFCPGTFAAVRQAFKAHPDADIVFGDMNVTDLQGRFMYRRRHLDFSFVTASLLGFTTVLSSNAVFWKKKAMEENGYFNESLRCNMDGDFYSRLTRGKVVLRSNRAFANFRKQPHTKASEKTRDWDALVRSEVAMERRDAYHHLAIAKWLPFRYAAVLKLPVHAVRVLTRLLHGHFLKQKRELKRYRAEHG